MKIKNIFIVLITLTLFMGVNKTINVHADKKDETIIKCGSRDKKMIALTFDDGPHPKETDQVLDVLKKYNAKATFFIAGKHANWYPQPLIRAHQEGHEIGNHTFNHPDISTLSPSQIEKEILDGEAIIQNRIGIKTNLFRPPYGSYREDKLVEIADKLGYKIVLWTTIDVKDWANPSATQMANTIINKAKNGDIILLHDYATNNTVEALDILIPQMQANGYEFVTVSQIIKNK